MLALLAFGIGLAEVAAQQDPLQPAPILRMMTESAEYCTHLAKEVADAKRSAATPSADAQTLETEGNRMCERGHVKGGIARLRRALKILRAGE
ncbi:hypothetical protein [Limobrevibacterium gyesilva]|uniref:Uncharacterized protein n=1 Tax=Limobrevibacterium gyesilva TaxID=2991712 RepID=A0AA41YPX8_9PROT|nr:hypothetical protein [Limobrevibacterium gyesilva]MCW3473382.1 hypothetical protein [Limobrevibacterium gyesilva]